MCEEEKYPLRAESKIITVVRNGGSRRGARFKEKFVCVCVGGTNERGRRRQVTGDATLQTLSSSKGKSVSKNKPKFKKRVSAVTMLSLGWAGDPGRYLSKSPSN